MPEVTFKTITQISFTLNLEDSQTIADVKKQIAEDKGEDYAVELQKLIYNGKILDDATTVGDIGIDTKKFVVVMLGRKKAPPAAELTPAVPTVVTTAPDVPPTTQAPVPATPSQPAPVVAAPAAPARPTTGSQTPEQVAMVDSISAMGYDRSQVFHALTVSDWNPDRAVDLLLGGIDDFPIDNINVEDVPQGGEEGAGNIEYLANLPQMDEIRELLRTNPALLPELMQQIAEINPDLMNLITNNQDRFLEFLRQGGAGAGQQVQGVGAPRQPGQGRENVIELTQEEAAAIQRIKSMGFRVPDGLILEAYLACDKNEEMAVDYILSRMGEEDFQ